MPSYAQSIGAALDAYPETDTFLHPRSHESVYAADYLSVQIVNTDEATLRRIVNFLLTGQNPPDFKPPDLKKLKHGGKLYTLLDGAERAHDKKLDQYNKRNKMADDPAAAGIDLSIREKYDAAISEWIDHEPKVGDLFWKNMRERHTLRSLLGLSREEHLRNINKIWMDIMELHVCSYLVSSMIDPLKDGQAFVSSHNLDLAFSRYGYAFRCETRTPEEVRKQGFLPRYRFDCPGYIEETILDQAANGDGLPRMVAIYKDNRDTVGQMGICVSRQMRGCTKFPEPKYEGRAYIYALRLDPSKKLGFDTERWQMSKKGEAVWRPGEKLFYEVQWSEVLASLPIWKLPARRDQEGEFFRFIIPSRHWRWFQASDEQRRHLDEELDELYNYGQEEPVMEAEDFYNDQKDARIRQADRAALPPVHAPGVHRCDKCQQVFQTNVLLRAHKCPAVKAVT